MSVVLFVFVFECVDIGGGWLDCVGGGDGFWVFGDLVIGDISGFYW